MAEKVKGHHQIQVIWVTGWAPGLSGLGWATDDLSVAADSAASPPRMLSGPSAHEVDQLVAGLDAVPFGKIFELLA